MIWEYADRGLDVALYRWWGALYYEGSSSCLCADGADSYEGEADGGDERVRLFWCFDAYARDSLNGIWRFVVARVVGHGMLTLRRVLQSLHIWLHGCFLRFEPYKITVLRNGKYKDQGEVEAWKT